MDKVLEKAPAKVAPDLPFAAPASFTKRDTAVIKGIAICLLLCHHLYMGILPAPMSLTGNSPLLVFATLSKVCVAIFMLLSGYGLAVSYSRKKHGAFRFTVEHVFGLMKEFWLIFVIFFVLSIFFARPEATASLAYGSGFRGVFYALVDFLGLRPIFASGTLNQTWWYMEAALVLYIVFPLLYIFTKKLPWLSLPITAIPVVLYFILGNNVWDTCREIYWAFPFCAGIFIAQRELFNRFTEFTRKRNAVAVLASIALLFGCVFIRAKLGIAFDTFFAVSIILFSAATLCRIPFLSGLLNYFGRHSADIFMIHSFFYAYFTWGDVFRKLLWSPSVFRRLCALPLLLICSLIASELISLFRRISGYDRLFPVGEWFEKHDRKSGQASENL